MNRPMQVRRSSAPFVSLHEAPTAAAVSATLQHCYKHTTIVFLPTRPITQDIEVGGVALTLIPTTEDSYFLRGRPSVLWWDLPSMASIPQVEQLRQRYPQQYF